ncbi:hypothetical protein MJO28_007102 [Puccinia striiformis f. sp. tritici]|uniref:Uncharacterized protein n=1 Tax=Puccinia striiformis f. sp. tritici TaxID=168172 RepID=A0ACC0EEQ4_9BASI|nr:hypothetical protein MJO28_007102 [Puccinia striiformis f. sp. tritici]
MIKQDILDPEGMEARLRRTFICRVYQVQGPHHIWAADGHDKLKKYKICVLGPGRYLGCLCIRPITIHVMLPTYFLRLALEIGGTPHKVTTDFGTETVQMGAYQMWLSSRYAGITIEEAETQMHFTKSTLNQKIEGLWSQMMKQHNWSVIAIIKEEIHWGGYQAADQVQKYAKTSTSYWLSVTDS